MNEIQEYKQAERVAQQNQVAPYIDSILEFHKHISSPSAKDDLHFNEINKDLVLSNLSWIDIMKVRALDEMIGYAELYGLPMCFRSFTRDIMITVNSASAKDGFSRIALVTQITKASNEIKEIQARPSFFGGFKK